MIPLKRALTSSIGRKVLNGLTAFGLVLYVVLHLIGNLTLYGEPTASEQAFNEYAAALHDFGVGLWILEILLLVAFLIHAYLGVRLWAKNRAARKERYAAGQRTKGGPSKFNLMSKTMAWSGVVLFIFVVVHVLQMRFGLFVNAEDFALPDSDMLNLYQLVDVTFEEPGWVVFYCVAVGFMGLHLRHGVWSMFQSLGVMNAQWTKILYPVAAVVAVLLFLGFFFIPIYMFFT